MCGLHIGVQLDLAIQMCGASLVQKNKLKKMYHTILFLYNMGKYLVWMINTGERIDLLLCARKVGRLRREGVDRICFHVWCSTAAHPPYWQPGTELVIVNIRTLFISGKDEKGTLGWSVFKKKRRKVHIEHCFTVHWFLESLAISLFLSFSYQKAINAKSQEGLYKKSS